MHGKSSTPVGRPSGRTPPIAPRRNQSQRRAPMGLADPCRPRQREGVPRIRNSARIWASEARPDQPGSITADAIGGSGETTSETASFLCPERSNLVELALRPSTPAPREQRQPRREQRAEATDSEAHGIPAGPVFRLRSGRRSERYGSRPCEGARDLRPDGEVGRRIWGVGARRHGVRFARTR
jgi:hypothetical protein